MSLILGPRLLFLSNFFCTHKLTGEVKNLKIGILDEGFTHCDTEICEVVKTAIEKLSALGATIEEVSIPQHHDGETF